MNVKHGLHRSPTWMSWQAMIQRCTNEKHADFPLYGARGIKVCVRWRSLVAFVEDMGLRPEGLTLDRIDTNGDYTPENCRWATLKRQRANQRPYPLQRRNQSGMAGVRFDAPTNRWTAKHPKLKQFTTKDFFEACCFRKSAENKFTSIP